MLLVALVVACDSSLVQGLLKQPTGKASVSLARHATWQRAGLLQSRDTRCSKQAGRARCHKNAWQAASLSRSRNYSEAKTVFLQLV